MDEPAAVAGQDEIASVDGDVGHATGEATARDGRRPPAARSTTRRARGTRTRSVTIRAAMWGVHRPVCGGRLKGGPRGWTNVGHAPRGGA
jgi:hypothetical protein